MSPGLGKEGKCRRGQSQADHWLLRALFSSSFLLIKSLVATARVRLRPELDLAASHHIIVVRDRAVSSGFAQKSPDDAQQLKGAVRLRHIVVAARCPSFLLIPLHREGVHRDDR